MKKRITIGLALLICFSLCACSGMSRIKDLDLPPLPSPTEKVQQAKSVPTPTETPTLAADEAEADVPEETPPAEETAAALTASDGVIVRYTKTSIEQMDPENGTEKILDFSYVTPTLRIDQHPEAAEKINSFFSDLNESFYNGGNIEEGGSWGYLALLEAAEDNYTFIKESCAEDLPMAFFSDRTVELTRADDRIISFLVTNSEYTGGAHGSYSSVAYVFDGQTGEAVSLENLMNDSYAFQHRVSDYMIHQVEIDPDLADHVDTDFVNALGGYTAAFIGLLRDGSWCFTQDGMLVFSSLYEIGPYAAGIAEFRIPYSELTELIDAKWFPAERSGEGGLLVSSDPGETGTYMDRISAGEGAKLCLQAEGTVFDLEISTTAEADDRSGDPIWYCSAVNGDAVLIQLPAPKDGSDLMLSYRDGSGRQTKKLLSFDENSSQYVLTDTVEASGTDA